MGKYIIKREGVTATTGNDVLTIISASNRSCRVVEFSAGGAIVPSKADHSDQPAAAFTTATTWHAG